MASDKTLKSLKPAAYNPRKITMQQLKMLKNALEEFGDLGGIVYNRRTDRLIGGHQRCKVLPKDAPIEITKTYDQPTRTGTVSEGYIVIDGERFSYREVDWDETKEKAANIAANAHSGDWEIEKLEEVLKDIANSDIKIDIELTGFTLSDIYQTFGRDILKEDPEQLIKLSEQLRSTTKVLENVKKQSEDINNAHFYMVVIFRSYEERKAFTDRYGLPDNRYIDGDTIISLIEKPT